VEALFHVDALRNPQDGERGSRLLILPQDLSLDIIARATYRRVCENCTGIDVCLRDLGFEDTFLHDFGGNFPYSDLEEFK